VKRSIFRLGFHTGFLSSGITSLSKKEVDLASISTAFDPRFKLEISLQKALTNYGKPLKGALPAAYWDGILKARDPPKLKLSENKESKIAGATREPLDATSPSKTKENTKSSSANSKSTTTITSKTTENADEKKTKNMQPKVESSLAANVEELAKELENDDDDDVDIDNLNIGNLSFKADEKNITQKLFFADLDDDDEDVDDETTAALLQQVIYSDESAQQGH
jgi:mannose/fructose/N-acetylgalactosamine-specific phosphotransferase system component IIB